MKKMKLAIASASMLAAGGAFALGYDADATTPSGDRLTERHVWQTALEPGECQGLCTATNAEETEVLGIVNIANATGCTPAATTCTPAPAVPDTYCGGNLTSTTSCAADYPGGFSSNAPVLQTVSVFSPQADPSAGNSIESELGQDTAPITVPFAWKIETNAIGKITAGWWLADTTFNGVTVIGFVNLSDSSAGTGASLTTYYSNPAGIATVDIDCFLDGDSTDCGIDNGGGGADFANGDVVFSNYTDASYITEACDEISGKAVPMPAFAAAALGLGLVGVTVLTGRRRQVK